MTKQNEDLEVIEVPNRQGTKIHTLCYKGVSLYQLREAWPDLWPLAARSFHPADLLMDRRFWVRIKEEYGCLKWNPLPGETFYYACEGHPESVSMFSSPLSEWRTIRGTGGAIWRNPHEWWVVPRYFPREALEKRLEDLKAECEFLEKVLNNEFGKGDDQ